MGLLALLLSAAPSAPWGQAGDPITFSVIGDAPYSVGEIAELRAHMEDHNLFSPSDFLVHVGDIKAADGTCVEQHYRTAADLLRLLAVPAFVVLGDNEWGDCRDPGLGLAWWEQHLLGIEEVFCGTPAVEAQASRRENFAFVEKGVLFIGLNVASSTSAVLQDDADWVDAQFGSKGALVRAVVLFGHREPSGRLLDAVRARAAAFGGPVLYVHGNGHSYQEESRAFGASNILRVQVPRATSSNPPIHFTIDENGNVSVERDPWPRGTQPLNRAPCVDAGADLTLSLGESASLAGRVVDDGVGGDLRVTWSQRSGPGVTTFSHPHLETTSATFSEKGTYLLDFTGADGELAAIDSLQVTVKGVPALSVDDLFVAEGDDAVFTVTLEDADGSGVTVDYETADDTARAGQDYAATTGFLSFGGATTQRQVSVPVPQDPVREDAEGFSLDLLNPSGALLHHARGNAIILDDDEDSSLLTLTLPPSPGGSVTLNPPGGGYLAGTVVVLTAIPDAGYRFAGWGGDLSGSANPGTLVVDAHERVTASFVATTFTLSVRPAAGGTVTLSPPGGTYPVGTAVTATAAADPGFRFSGWGGALSGTTNPQTLIVDADTSVGAGFLLSETGDVSFREAQSGGSENSDRVATAAPLSAVAGDLYVAAIASKPRLSVASVAGLGLDWTPAGAQCAGRGQTGVEVWVGQGPASGDGIVAATLASAASTAVIAAVHYAGAQAAVPIGSVVSANTLGVAGGCSGGRDTAVYGFDLTTTASGSRVLVAAAMRNKDHSPGAGYGKRLDVSQGSGGGQTAGTSIADRLVESPGRVRVDGSFSGTADWAVVAAEIRAAELPTTFFDVRIDLRAAAHRAPRLARGSPHRRFAQVGGSVTLSPPGGTYPSGSVVTVTALPDPRHVFTGWGGDLAGTNNPEALVVDSDKTVSASFTATHTLSVPAPANGSVTLSPPGGTYPRGTRVTVTAVPDPRYVFTGWGGDLAGTNNPETLVVDADQQVSASFTETFTLTAAAAEGGRIALDPPGGTHLIGTRVTVTAVPDPRYVFAGWGGDLAGTNNPETLVADADKQVSASFTETFTLTAAVAEGGRVALDPPGGTYLIGTPVTVTALPDPRYVFTGWSGDLSGTNNPETLVADADQQVSASFTETFTLTAAVAEGGRVALDPPGGTYLAGTPVTVTALPDPRYVFSGWGGDLSGTNNPETLVADADKQVSASFTETFTLTAAVAEGGRVALDPPGGTYLIGTRVTVTAVPDPRHVFSGWSGDLSGTNNPETLVADADQQVSASFTETFTLTAAVAEGGRVALDPPGGTYLAGTRVTLTAVPEPDYVFTGWGGDLSGTNNPVTLVADADRTVTAGFSKLYTLTVSEATGGQVTLDPPGGIYPDGSVVTLTAIPDPGLVFTGWGGALSGVTNPKTLRIDADETVEAGFAPKPLEVTFGEAQSGGSEGSAVVATDAPVSAAAGDLYVAAISSKPGLAVASVSGLGLSWTPVGAQCAARGQTRVEVWTARGQSSVDGVVTATLASAATNAVIAVVRYSGAGALGSVVSANSFGVSGGCSGGRDSAAYGFDLATTGSGSLVFVAAAMRSSDHIPGAGYTERVQVSHGSTGGQMASTSVAARVVGTPGLVRVDGGFGGNVDWAVVAAEIRVAN